MSALPKLTPAQDLMMDLLIARSRLGEPFWPVGTEFHRTYKVLEEKGYVSVLSGNVEKTVRLMLTDAAKKQFITDSTYKTPMEQKLAGKIADHLEKKGGDPTTIRMIRKHWSDR